MLSFVSSVSACREDFLCAELSLNNILPIQPNLHIINKKCSTFLVRPVSTQIDFSRCLVCFHWAILRFLSDLTSLCHHSSPLFSASSKWTCPSLTTTLSTSPPPWWPWFVPLWRSNWPQVKHTETHHTLLEVANRGQGNEAIPPWPALNLECEANNTFKMLPNTNTIK